MRTFLIAALCTLALAGCMGEEKVKAPAICAEVDSPTKCSEKSHCAWDGTVCKDK